jgi:hypothetical protein
MKRCHCCQGKFGLIRHYYNQHHFCRTKCVVDYRRKLQRLIAEKKFRTEVVRGWFAA